MRDHDKTKEQLIRELNELRNKTYGYEKPDALNNELEKKHLVSIVDKDIKSAEQHIIEQNKEIIKFLKESRLFSHWPDRLIKQLIPLSEFEDFTPGSKILMEGQKNDNTIPHTSFLNKTCSMEEMNKMIDCDISQIVGSNEI